MLIDFVAENGGYFNLEGQAQYSILPFYTNACGTPANNRSTVHLRSRKQPSHSTQSHANVQ